MTDLNLLDWSAQEKALRSMMKMRAATLAHKAKGNNVDEQLTRLQEFHKCIVLNEQLIGTVSNQQYRERQYREEIKTLRIEKALAEAECNRQAAEIERLNTILNALETDI